MKEKTYTFTEFLNKLDPEGRVGDSRRVGEGRTLLKRAEQSARTIIRNPILKRIAVTSIAVAWTGVRAYADTLGGGQAAKSGIWGLCWKVIDVIRLFAILLCIGLCFRDIIEAITEGAGVKDIFGYVVKYGIIIILFWVVPELFLSIPTYFGSPAYNY